MRDALTASLLSDAERIFRDLLDGRGELGLYGDIRSWLRSHRTSQRQRSNSKRHDDNGRTIASVGKESGPDKGHA